MLRKVFAALIFASLPVYHLCAQSVAEVMSNKDMYIYEIGYGETIEEADQNALNQLTNRSAQIFSSKKSEIFDQSSTKGDESTEIFASKTYVTNHIYLENIGRFILPESNSQKRVMRYVLVEEWENRFDFCKSAIQDYITSGIADKESFRIDDALRNFSWAYLLLQIYPKTDIEIEGSSIAPKQYCINSLNDIFTGLDIKVIGIEDLRKNSGLKMAYPYQIFLDITYKGEPVNFLNFNYFDGESIVKGATAKDGRSTIDMVSLPSTFDFYVEFLHKDLALNLDPNIYALLDGPCSSFQMESSRIVVKTCPDSVKPKQKVNTSSKKVKSVVKEKLEQEVKNQVATYIDYPVEQTFNPIMDKIIEGISGNNIALLEEYFTPESWEEFSRVVASGSPRLARTPELRYLQLDTLVICRSIPLKLKFKGNNAFIEDVALRFSTKSRKVTGLSYTLSSRTEKDIMSMKWDDRARIMLLNFLEDYRTAYCLKDADFIEKIFADDAYIIVGKKLTKAKNISKEDSSINLDKETVVYQTKTKRQYIHDLKESFRSKEFVNIRFEECDPAKGYGAKEGIYAVQVRQHYFSNNYADDGFLTLAIDMRDNAHPLVKVRVWQKDKDPSYTAETMIERTVSTKESFY